MAFELRVLFTGIIGVVPHRDGGRAMLVLPNAVQGPIAGPGYGDFPQAPGKALDGGELRLHYPFVQVAQGHTGGALPRWSEIVWYLSDERLSFPTPKGGTPDPDALSCMLRSSELCPAGCEMDPEDVSAAPSSSKVLAQVLLEGGTFLGTQYGGPWTVPDTLGGGIDPARPLAYAGIWSGQYDGDTLTVDCTSFTDGTVRTVQLHPEDGRIVLVVGNLCQTNPLNWKVPGGLLTPDGDVRWHYQMLDAASRKVVEEELALRGPGAELPIPYPAPGARFESRPLDQRFDPDPPLGEGDDENLRLGWPGGNCVTALFPPLDF